MSRVEQQASAHDSVVADLKTTIRDLEDLHRDKDEQVAKIKEELVTLLRHKDDSSTMLDRHREEFATTELREKALFRNVQELQTEVARLNKEAADREHVLEEEIKRY